MRGGRILELDGLRALAVLAVISFHYTLANPLANPVTRMGWVGVELFFVLSGYLITGILLSTRERPHYFSTFYARRTLRIFPVYYLVLTIYVISARIWGGPQPWTYWVMHATYLSSIVEHFHYWAFPAPEFVYAGVTVLWSLSIEEQFYLLWAPVVRWIRPQRLWWVLGGVVVGAPVLRWFIHNPGYTEYRFLPARFDSLAWGALLAMIERHNGLGDARPWRRLALAAGIALAALTGATGGLRSSHWFATLGYTLVCVLFMALLAWVLARQASAAAGCRLLRWRPLQALGKISYATYLIHYPIFILTGGLVAATLGGGAWATVARAILSLTLALVVAGLSWRLVESPILRFKDRWKPAQTEKGEPGQVRLRTERIADRA